MARPLSVEQFGTDLVIRMDDGTRFRALQAAGDLYVVGKTPDPKPDPNPGDPPPPVNTNEFRWPFPRGSHTSYSGHSGADWPGGGKPIRAVGPGVVQARYATNYNTNSSAEPVWRGNCLVIDHGKIGGHRIWSLYAHMAHPPGLNPGDRVQGGQLLGSTGNTGFSFGAHLHFEIIFDGVRLRTGQGGYERTMAWMSANAKGTW